MEFSKLNIYGEDATTQVVEVEFPSTKQTYSYIGSGNLRTGQNVSAPVTHSVSGKNYIAPKATVVGTHKLTGAQVGDKLGVSGDKVHSIPKPLKYLPGTRETQQNRNITAGGLNISVNEYLEPFIKKLNAMGTPTGGK